MAPFSRVPCAVTGTLFLQFCSLVPTGAVIQEPGMGKLMHPTQLQSFKTNLKVAAAASSCSLGHAFQRMDRYGATLAKEAENCSSFEQLSGFFQESPRAPYPFGGGEGGRDAAEAAWMKHTPGRPEEVYTGTGTVR